MDDIAKDNAEREYEAELLAQQNILVPNPSAPKEQILLQQLRFNQYNAAENKSSDNSDASGDQLSALHPHNTSEKSEKTELNPILTSNNVVPLISPLLGEQPDYSEAEDRKESELLCKGDSDIEGKVHRLLKRTHDDISVNSSSSILSSEQGSENGILSSDPRKKNRSLEEQSD